MHPRLRLWLVGSLGAILAVAVSFGLAQESYTIAGLSIVAVAWLFLEWLGGPRPEAWVLALHAHQHTTAEPAQRAGFGRAKGKALLSGQHQHCHEESFYDAAFRPAAPVVVPGPVRTAAVGVLTPFAAAVWAEAVAAQRCLRGPPVA